MEISSNLVDILYCHEKEIADELFDFYLKKGHGVAMSTVQINTGTHGDCLVKKIEIYKN